LLQFGQVVLHTCVAQETHVPCFRAHDDDVEQIWPAMWAFQFIRQHTKRTRIIAPRPLHNRTARPHTPVPQTGNRRSPPIHIYHLLHYHKTGGKNTYAMCQRARWQIHILYVSLDNMINACWVWCSIQIYVGLAQGPHSTLVWVVIWRTIV